MTKLFRDVDYYIIEASNATQREFELDFADVIEVFDTNSVTLTTEDGKSLQITYDERGYFKSYFVDVEPITYQMSKAPYIADRVRDVINTLKSLMYNGESVDGETMQYILEKVGMEDQMLKQLISTADDYQINWYTNLRNIAKNNQ
jgi:hypothetical protein